MIPFLVKMEMIPFISSAGDDLFDGGADNDALNYSSLSTGINLSLLDNGAQFTVAFDGTDTIKNIENIIGSNTGNDIISGNNLINELIGGGGNDTLEGKEGADTILAGAGDDSIISLADGDYIDGGAGNDDWLDYVQVGNVSVDLRAGNATHNSDTDTINNIEHIKLANTGANTVIGNYADNSLIGGSGTNDTLSYESAGGSVNVNIQAGTASGDGADKISGFEHYILSNQSDTISNNSVDGITIEGKSGSDQVDYSNSTVSLTIDSTGTSHTVTEGGNTDTLSNIEKIVTGNGADIFNLTSTLGLETLDAGGGIDTLALSGNLDLSNITLLNFEKIIVANGDTLTLSARDLDDETYTIELQGNGSLIIESTALSSDHDFNNISIIKTGTQTGTVTLLVANSVDLTAHNINGTNSANSILDIITVNSGTLILSESQVTKAVGSIAVNGTGSVIVEVSADSNR